jgi:hypothetical protein
VAVFASARALSAVLCTHNDLLTSHRSLSGAVIAIFEVYGAISAHFPIFTHRNGHVMEVGYI